MWSRAIDVVFPRRCAGCGDGAWPFCSGCLRELVVLEPPWCVRCGRPSALPVPMCRDCPPAPVTSARAPFLYRGPAKRAIHRLKFSGWRDVAAALADAMVVALGTAPADVITWVPLSRRRRAERGYDQARALAVAVGHRTGLPVVRLLRRSVSTRPQATRSAFERRAAMRGAFVATGPAPARVLLVDDVLTTGATAAGCAQALAEGGAREVHVATAARALSGGGLPLRAPRADVYARVGSRPGLWLPGDPPR